jgi:uncharacterized protein YbaR (Trm112 family)
LSEGTTVLDERLLDILACPIDKGPLLYFPDPGPGSGPGSGAGDGGFLYNPRLGVRYPVDLGVPVLLADASERLGDQARRDLAARAARGEASATAGASVPDVLTADA